MKIRILNFFRTIFKIPFSEQWLRGKTLNKSVDSFWAKLAPNNYQYRSGSIRKFLYNGIKLELDISDYFPHYLYFGFEDNAHKNLMSLVKKDDVILDIGTNYGTTILQFAKLTGDNGRCYGFEPDPINFKICQKNLSLNSFENISVENVGLGNEAAELFLVVDTATNRGGNRISDDIEGKENYKVKIIRIDDWIDDKEIKKIDLVKIDVEGFETNVLKGGIQTWKKLRPILFIELDDDNLRQQNSSAKELVGLVERLGYSIKKAGTREIISSENFFTKCHYDIVCYPI